MNFENFEKLKIFIFFAIFGSVGGAPGRLGRRLPTGCCCPPLGGLGSTRDPPPIAPTVAPLEILDRDIPCTSGMDVEGSGGAGTTQIGARPNVPIFGP